jgi:threonine synthase
VEKSTGIQAIYIKDEGMNPTGSFKARGLSVAVSRAVELAAVEFSIPSAGNAAGALSAYSAKAGKPAFVFMPRDVPLSFVVECRALGASVQLVDGLITDCARIAGEEASRFNRFDLSTLKEPYRLEGKKTMGYEIAEQLGWELPEVIIYPTGGGTGLVGLWKAFGEMEEMGWISEKRPRMVSVQATGCAPIVKAFREKRDHAEAWSGAKTIADGLRVPSAVGDFLILDILRKSHGIALDVSDEEMMKGAEMIGSNEGLFVSPESGATIMALIELNKRGWIQPGERTVLFNTGSGYKYSHLWK